MSLTSEDVQELARVVSTTTVDAIESHRRRAEERIYGLKTIAIECGVSDDTLRVWVNRKSFPLDRDPRGFSVKRWLLERWFEAHRQAVDKLKTRVSTSKSARSGKARKK